MRNGKPADVIVVGAGHNGLVAACYLAKAGHDVLVLEAAEAIGGCTTGGAVVEGAPDHMFSPGANDIITMRASTIEADLQLARHGFTQIEIDPVYVALGPEGTSIAFWRDPARAAEEMRRYSRSDADAYLELARIGEAAAGAMVPALTMNPARPPTGSLRRIAGTVARNPREMAIVASLATASAAQVIEERFRHPVVKSAMAMLAAFGGPIQLDGSGVNLVVPALVKRFGLGRPVGGMGSLPSALERCLTASGGRVRTSAPVESLLTSGGGVAGVRLAGGEEIRSRAVLTACDPRTALTELLPAGTLPSRLETRARHIPTLNAGAAHLKVDVALKGRLTLPAHQARRSDELDLRVPGHLIGSYEEILGAYVGAGQGKLANPMPFVGIIAAAADPSLAPEGEDTLYVWSGWTPLRPHESWDALAGRAAAELLEHASLYYEGIEDLEIGRAVEAWPDLAGRTRVPDGNIMHVDGGLLRQGPLRPALGLGGYRTPVQGLFLTGAGTHPGGSVSGIPGQLAAEVVIEDLGSAGASAGAPARAGSASAGRAPAAASTS